MKTIKASLLLPLLTMLFSLTLSGCYTQLAFVNDENDSSVESSPAIVYQPEMVTVFIPTLMYDPLSPPVFNPLSQSGASSTVTQSQSQSRTRDSGYQRSGQSGNSQTSSSDSKTRNSGSTRGGR